MEGSGKVTELLADLLRDTVGCEVVDDCGHVSEHAGNLHEAVQGGARVGAGEHGFASSVEVRQGSEVLADEAGGAGLGCCSSTHEVGGELALSEG